MTFRYELIKPSLDTYGTLFDENLKNNLMPRKGGVPANLISGHRPGRGRPLGSKNAITKEWVEKHLRWRVTFDPVAALLERRRKGPDAIWTLRDLANLSEQERMCLESYDIVKGNVDASDNALETVIKPRWYAKDKALELCARSLGMLKDKVEVTLPEEQLSRLDRAKIRARKDGSE